MTTRYKTPGEIAGVKRRMAAWRERQRAAGLRERAMWLTDAETDRIRAIVAAWRDERNDLNEEQRAAAQSLKPAQLQDSLPDDHELAQRNAAFEAAHGDDFVVTSALPGIGGK
ncbi:MAG: hypothetical protein KGI47_10740 [Betaproteobacteria bacterium]|nr:hypothetical protein [Betaproteobacteria bacterium]